MAFLPRSTAALSFSKAAGRFCFFHKTSPSIHNFLPLLSDPKSLSSRPLRTTFTLRPFGSPSILFSFCLQLMQSSTGLSSKQRLQNVCPHSTVVGSYSRHLHRRHENRSSGSSSPSPSVPSSSLLPLPCPFKAPSSFSRRVRAMLSTRKGSSSGRSLHKLAAKQYVSSASDIRPARARESAFLRHKPLSG